LKTSGEQDYVFGYGSLLNPRSRAAEGSACGLMGFRRTWDVAMDNTRTIPGYKYYLDAVSGDRPAVFVTFLNLRPSPGEVVSGVAFPVDSDRLAALDRRERNYTRIDMTDNVASGPTGRIWTYLGSQEGRERFERGVERGTAVVSEEYYAGVRQSFEGGGDAAVDDFERTTDTPAVPMRELIRVDVPL